MWTTARLLVLLSAVTLASPDHLPADCVLEGRTVPDGGHVTKAEPCHLCHCHGGRLECVWKHCGAPPARCRRLHTQNGCNNTVYLCPFPDDSSKDKTTSSDGDTTSRDRTAADVSFTPRFSALSPAGAPPSVQFSLLPPPLSPLSPLQSREASSEGSDRSALPGATYFSEITSAPMNFSATLGRGEGPRSRRRLAGVRGNIAAEAGHSERLQLSTPRPWTVGQFNDWTAERTTERNAIKTTQSSTERPALQSWFRVKRPDTAWPSAQSTTRAAPRSVPRISAEDLTRTTSKTTPRAKTWTTSRTTAHSPSHIPTRSSARTNPKSRFRFPQRANSLSAARERTQTDRRHPAQTTTQRPVRKADVDLVRIAQHPIVRPRLRTLSFAETSRLARTTARPEKSSEIVTEPRRITPRPDRRPQKTLSISRHRLHRLFPSTVRSETDTATPDTDIGLRKQHSQEQSPATVGPESTTFISVRRRSEIQPVFHPSFSSNTIPRPRSRPRPAPSFSDSPSAPDIEAPLSFSPLEKASEPVLPSAPAPVPLAAPVVSFDYDLEDDDIDLSEYEFPEFGRRLRRETARRTTGVSRTAERGAALEEDAGPTEAAEGAAGPEHWIEDRVRRSLLPGDGRHGHGHHGQGHGDHHGQGHDGHHGQRDQQDPHHPDAHSHREPGHRLLGNHDRHRSDFRDIRHQGDSHHGRDLLSKRHRVAGYYRIGAKKLAGSADGARLHPERGGAEAEDPSSGQLLSLDQGGPTTCFVSGVRYQLAEVIEAASDSCLECRCAGTAMVCYPKCCFYSTEEPRAGHTAAVLHPSDRL